MEEATPTPTLLTPLQAAKRLRVKTKTLQEWRHTGRYNLPFVKCGRLVRYKAEDIQSFLQRRTRSTTARPRR
jgi:excisionase family DNA binding protein